METYRYIYILGIGGIGMSALGRWYRQQGKQVWGHDRARSSLTDALEAEGIPIHFQATPAAIPPTIRHHPSDTLVIYSPSILPSHPLRAYLTQQGYTLCKRSDVLDKLTAHHDTWAVAGSHGKTTTTTLLTHILYQAQQPVMGFLGGISKNYHTNFIAPVIPDQQPLVVIEADEFDRFFLHLHPHLAIITTIDPDHLEIYEDTAGFEEAFRLFLSLLPSTGLAILHREVAKKLLSAPFPIQASIQTYGLTDAPVYAQNVQIDKKGHYHFDYVSEVATIRAIRLTMPGYHMIENTLAVITACLYKQVPPSTIREAIHTFAGVERRFDSIMEQDGIVLIDDYAHHPVEIATVLKTVRIKYPGKKITVIFQPNQFSRTQHFLLEIANSLALADAVLVVDIYSDRELPIAGINAAAIIEHVPLPYKYVCNGENLIENLSKVPQLEIIVNMGAGDADSFLEPIKNFLLTR